MPVACFRAKVVEGGGEGCSVIPEAPHSFLLGFLLFCFDFLADIQIFLSVAGGQVDVGGEPFVGEEGLVHEDGPDLGSGFVYGGFVPG